jgi:hypothetical protein
MRTTFATCQTVFALRRARMAGRRRLPARTRRARGLEAVRGRRQDRREGRDGHREDGARGPRRAAAGARGRPEARGGEVDAAWDAAASSTRPSEWQVAAENPQVRMLARRISEAAGGGRQARRGDRGPARRGGDVRLPPHGARHRLPHGVRARHLRRQLGLPRPRPPGVVLRGRPEEQAVGHLALVGLRLEAGQQEAEEPARLLVQLPRQEQLQVRGVLPALPREGHVPRRGAEGDGEEEIEGDLHHHEGQGPLLGLGQAGRNRDRHRDPRGSASACPDQHAARPERSLVRLTKL